MVGRILVTIESKGHLLWRFSTAVMPLLGLLFSGLSLADQVAPDAPMVSTYAPALHQKSTPRWVQQFELQYGWGNQEEACQGPADGEIRGFHLSGEESPTTVGADYALEKVKGKNKYIAHLVFNFAEVGVSDGSTEAKLKPRVHECLKQINKSLAHSDGTQLEIQVHSVYDHLPQAMVPREMAIGIHDGDYRSNREAFNEDFDCTVLLHELGHRMGLVDEYLEKKRKNKFCLASYCELKPAFTCRSLGPVRSLMHDHAQAFAQLQPSIPYTVNTCACNSSKEICAANALNIFKAQKCLAPFRLAHREKLRLTRPPDWVEGKGIVSYPHPIFDDGELPFTELPTKGKMKEPVVKSLLTDAQFNSIVFPFCRAKNEIYYSCNRNAYRSPEVEGCDEEASAICEKHRWQIWPEFE